MRNPQLHLSIKRQLNNLSFKQSPEKKPQSVILLIVHPFFFSSVLRT